MPSRTEPPNHLVVVCGHAIWAGGPTNGQDESEWIMEDWKRGETPTYTAHIKAGLQVLSEDDRAILVFSGGPTAPSTRLSEARSYANLAAANAYWGLLPSAQSSLPSPAAASAPPPPSHPPRILLEERALDSYQNILHSLTTFWRSTAHTHWPWRLTIVSHAFKRRRLAHVHCAALGFPLGRVSFIGINPPGLPEVLASEERAVEAWVQDPEGRGPGLRGKREGRNCGGVSQRVFLDEAERAKSGVETVVGEDEDGDEYLVPGGWRPWAEGV